jgi:hypothetical protein
VGSPRNGGRLQHFGVKSLLVEVEVSCEAARLLSTVRFMHASWVGQNPVARMARVPVVRSERLSSRWSRPKTGTWKSPLSVTPSEYSMIAGFSL